MVIAPTERFKFRRPMAAAAGKKSTTSLAFVRALQYGYPNLGRRGMDKKIVHGTPRSMAESDSRGSDVEASERACRSSDLRDP